MGWFTALLLLTGCIWLFLALKRARARADSAEIAQERAESERDAALQRQAAAEAEVARLAPFQGIANADAEVARLYKSVREAATRLLQEAREAATAEREAARAEANNLRNAARELTRKAKTEAEQRLQAAADDAAATLQHADMTAEKSLHRARGEAAEALALRGQEMRLQAAVQALENRLRGYDDRYLQPAALLLEGLAEGYGQEDAALALKAARAHTRRLIASGRAAACDYVEPQRRQTAERFVLTAFNGAADAILARVRASDAGTLAQELQDAAAVIDLHGRAFRNARITAEYFEARQAELQAAARFQALLKRDQEEQRAIRERIRDEARAQREFEAAERSAARDEERARRALDEARARFDAAAAASDRERMQLRLATLEAALAEAEAKRERTLSLAQQTRAGHCYVISNEGSFGADVLKIGMTRRLDPLDRVRELGDASVPFEFDVHAMVYSDDAPTLERALHRSFNDLRVNMVNPRKEYFRVSLASVRERLSAMGVTAQFTMTAAAREYRETLALQQASEAQRHAALAAVLSAEEAMDDDAEEVVEEVAEEVIPSVEALA